ncbi:E3 ubiquitin-protein ligase TRIM7-like [Parus major]|uniref:E3 ubiquitin-protein ligase TRIM7-like n=1 Tax=Parus major TaxID=9157 RepID=UPI0007712A8E|nr:E3 ubiquitin-protein ligase TRIM7-like [Parus major]
MAGPSPAEQLRAEASCPVCLELFQEPVSIPCGHSFCRGCIERCWQSSRGSFACPRCRNVAPEPGLRPNRELGHVADIARGLLPAAPGTLCGRHREPLQLFCRDERALLCLVCGRSRLHRLHRVVPAEEAAQEYKEQIQNCLQALRDEREKYLESRKSGAQRSLHLDKTRSEGQRTAQEFRELQRFLEEKERLLLAQLGDLDRAIGRAQDEALAKVSEELSQLDTLVWEMEGKFQQPPSHFLQDLQQLLDSCEMMKFHPPAEISSDLERSLEDFVQRNILVRGTLRRCQDSLMFQLQEPGESGEGRAAVLVCAGSGKSGPIQVEVGQGGVWALGVVRESARRRGPLSLTPKEGVWALEAFHSLTSPRASLRPQPPPRRLRVSLDYEGRRVAFFSAGDDIPILEYTRAAFNGERVLPWFKMGMGARLLEVTRGCEDRAVAGQVTSPLDWVGFGFSLRICP